MRTFHVTDMCVIDLIMLKRTQLAEAATKLRAVLEPAFSIDTASRLQASGSGPSSGHCAAVALIAATALPCGLASARISGGSHWFNRVFLESGTYDMDLTGDQYGLAPVRVARKGGLYRGTAVRDVSQIDDETRLRAIRLANRAGLAEIAEILSANTAHSSRSHT